MTDDQKTTYEFLALELRSAVAAAAALMGLAYDVAATMPVNVIERRLLAEAGLGSFVGVPPRRDDPTASTTTTLRPGALLPGEWRQEDYDPYLRYERIDITALGNTEQEFQWVPITGAGTTYPRVIVNNSVKGMFTGMAGDQIGIDGGHTPELIFVQLDDYQKGNGYWFRLDDIRVNG